MCILIFIIKSYYDEKGMVSMTKLSMITLLLAGLTSMATAEVKSEISGQGVFYYQTNNGGDNNFLDQESSSASAGLELNGDVDFGNDLKLGTQGTFLGTLGLEKWMISNSRQNAKVNDKNDVALTKLFLSKQIANTFVKVGRQELEKSISPFAFSEWWNVFSNHFDAAVIKNSDIENTNIIAYYIDAASQHNGLNSFDDLSGATNTVAADNFEKGAYALTIQNESLKDMPITASYYKFRSTATQDTEALWGDIKVKNLPLKLELQGGQIDPSANVKTTRAYGAKVTGKLESTQLSLAYSSVNDGQVQLRNFGTGNKTPLYTQMIGNQGFISTDADTIVFKSVTKLASGKFIAQYDNTKDNSVAGNDYQELDLVYKFKAYDMNMLLAYIGQRTANATFASEKSANNLRFWTRYNF